MKKIKIMEYIIIGILICLAINAIIVKMLMDDVKVLTKEVKILEKMVFKMDEYYTKEITNSSSPTSYEEKCNQYRKIFEKWDELSFEEKRDRINNFRCGF